MNNPRSILTILVTVLLLSCGRGKIINMKIDPASSGWYYLFIVQEKLSKNDSYKINVVYERGVYVKKIIVKDYTYHMFNVYDSANNRISDDMKMQSFPYLEKDRSVFAFYNPSPQERGLYWGPEARFPDSLKEVSRKTLRKLLEQGTFDSP